MKKLFKVLLLSTLSVYIIAGCSAERTREDKVAAIIGKVDSPFFVVSMTPQNLMDKSGIMDGVLPFTYEMVLSFFIDESVTGIDYSVKTQIVVGKGKSFQPSFYGIFKIKDEVKFKELIEKEANATIVEKDGMKTAIKEKDGYAVVWNEEFAIISNIPIDFAAMFNGGGAGQGDATVTKLIDLIKAADDGEINTTYAEFLKKDADISMYYDGKGFYGFMKDMMQDEAEEIEKMKDTYEGLTSEIFINFGNGSIDFEFANTLSDLLKEKMSFLGQKGIEGKLLSYSNSANPILVGGYSFDFTKFFEYVESQMDEDDYEGMERDISEMGLTIDEVKKSLTGEFVYMIDHVSSYEEVVDYGYGDPFTYTRRIPMFALAVGIGNVAPIKALLVDSLKQSNGSYKMGDAYLVLDNDVLFATNDSAWSTKVVKHTTVPITKGKDILAKDPFTIFVDFASLASMEGMKDAEAYIKLFKEFSGGANIEGGSFKFVLNDSSKNALRLLAETVSAELTRIEQLGNENLEKEMEEAILQGLDELDEELEEVEL